MTRSCRTRGAGWPLERVLFALAGTVTLLSALLAAPSPRGFCSLTAFVGVNQWLYVVAGACPASLVARARFAPCAPPSTPMRRSAPMTDLGPIGRLGRYTATHFRPVAIAWVVVAVGLGVFAPKVEHALSGAGWEATGSESVKARETDRPQLRRPRRPRR